MITRPSTSSTTQLRMPRQITATGKPAALTSNPVPSSLRLQPLTLGAVRSAPQQVPSSTSTKQKKMRAQAGDGVGGTAEGPPSRKQLYGCLFLNILYPKLLSFFNLKENIPIICMKVDKNSDENQKHIKSASQTDPKKPVTKWPASSRIALQNPPQSSKRHHIHTHQMF